MKTKTYLLAILLTIFSTALSAQDHPNPFAEFGDSSEILTLSNGKYIEVFDLDSVTQIGNALFNIRTNKLLGFVEQDTSFNEYTLQPEVASRWLSPDPLASKFPYITPYAGFENNPIFYVDPSGLAPIPGDFYNQKGVKVGTDGINDQKAYVVTDKKELKMLKKTDKAGGTTSLNQVSSAIELPSRAMRQEMLKVVAEDKKDNFREYGGVFGVDAQGNEVVAWAKPGPKSNPNTQANAQIDVWDSQNPQIKLSIMTYTGTFHSHPSGTTEDLTTGQSGATLNPGKKYYDPNPSPKDIQNASRRQASGLVQGNNYVLGLYNMKVSIYDGSGVLATFPIKKWGNP